MRTALPLLLVVALASSGCKLKKDDDPDGGTKDSGGDIALTDSDGPPPSDGPKGEASDGPGMEINTTPDLMADYMPHFEAFYFDFNKPKDAPVVTKDVSVPTKDSNTSPSSGTIGASGGTLISSDGRAVMIIWAGTLISSVNFTIKISPNTWGNMGPAYDFGPTNVSFAKKVKIIITYDPKLLKGASETNLKLGLISSGVWQSVPGATLNTTSNQVSGEVSGLGVYGVLCQGCKLDAGVPDGSTSDAVADAKTTDGIAAWFTA